MVMPVWGSDVPAFDKAGPVVPLLFCLVMFEVERVEAEGPLLEEEEAGIPWALAFGKEPLEAKDGLVAEEGAALSVEAASGAGDT